LGVLNEKRCKRYSFYFNDNNKFKRTIVYIGCFLAYIAGPDSWDNPYEYSLLYSFFSIFFILDYKKITDICIQDKLILLGTIFGTFIEPLVMRYV